MELFRDVVMIFAAAVVVVMLLRKIGVPSIAGFIVTGVLMGPQALGIVEDAHRVEVIAEIGVILLLFGIGLELSLERLKRLWKAVLVGGALQMGMTIVAVALIAVGFGFEFRQSLFLGFVIAVSSTAIVLRGLSSRQELETPHGRLALGILVFQDLSVVPMMLAVPLLAGQGGSGVEALAAMGKALLVLVAVVVGARFVVPRFLALVAGTRQRDIFVLSVFLICLGTAWLVSLAGISLALGAFLAGLVVAGSEYRHQAMSELIPLREVLASLFFVSVGMLLDPSALAGQLGLVLALLVAILAGKFLIIFLTALILRLPVRIAIITGATLAQVGEFAFILYKAGLSAGLVAEALVNPILAAIVFSMLITPMIIAFAPRLAQEVCRVNWLTRLVKVKVPEEAKAKELANHVIIAGYGLTGEALALELRKKDVPFVVADINIENIHRATRADESVYLGDVSRPEVLQELGLERAALLVVAINDARATERVISVARQIVPSVKILARTQFDEDVTQLERSGASAVVAAEREAAREIIRRVADCL